MVKIQDSNITIGNVSSGGKGYGNFFLFENSDGGSSLLISEPLFASIELQLDQEPG